MRLNAESSTKSSLIQIQNLFWIFVGCFFHYSFIRNINTGWVFLLLVSFIVERMAIIGITDILLFIVAFDVGDVVYVIKLSIQVFFLVLFGLLRFCKSEWIVAFWLLALLADAHVPDFATCFIWFFWFGKIDRSGLSVWIKESMFLFVAVDDLLTLDDFQLFWGEMNLVATRLERLKSLFWLFTQWFYKNW